MTTSPTIREVYGPGADDVERDGETGEQATTWELTWFRRLRSSAAGLRLSVTRDELLHQLADPFEHRGAKHDLHVICPATFRNERRRNDDVERVYMLGLDIDEPTNDPGAVVARVTSSLGGVEVFAYSTFSSMPAAFRLRAFVPYDRPATPVEHRMSWLLVARALAGGGVLVDKACKDPARGFFVWARPPSGAYWHGHVAGVAWPVGLAASVEEKRQAAAGTLGPRRTFPRSTSTAIGRARAYVAAVAPAVQGAHGSDATFVLAARLVHGFGLSESEALDALGPWNTTCAPPWSPRDLARKVREAAEKAHSFGRRPSGRATWKR